MTSKKEIFASLAEAVVMGDRDKAEKLAREVVSSKIDPYEAIMEGCSEGMKVVSDKYEKSEYYVPDILVAARAMDAAVSVLQPHIKVETARTPAKILIGSVEGDVHEIGKNLVKILLSSAGFNVVDLGKNVSAKAFVEALKREEPAIVGLSTLMTPTMITMKDTIAEFKKQGVRDNVKVVVGGAPVNADFAKQIGADGYAESAAKAVRLVEEILAGKRGADGK
jgi:corrinoid protein of di/trimethylamine methyltransferase